MEVRDFVLPNWSKDDPRKFTLILRKVLESTKVNKKLNLWIDLVFGYKQTGVEAEKNFNTFRSWCYYLDEEEKNEMIQQNEISNYMLIKQEFGYVPKQLFKKAHTEKKSFEEFKEYENIFFDDNSKLLKMSVKRINNQNYENKKKEINIKSISQAFISCIQFNIENYFECNFKGGISSLKSLTSIASRHSKL